jgi:hypothetical protein
MQNRFYTETCVGTLVFMLNTITLILHLIHSRSKDWKAKWFINLLGAYKNQSAYTCFGIKSVLHLWKLSVDTPKFCLMFSLSMFSVDTLKVLSLVFLVKVVCWHSQSCLMCWLQLALTHFHLQTITVFCIRQYDFYDHMNHYWPWLTALINIDFKGP